MAATTGPMVTRVRLQSAVGVDVACLDCVREAKTSDF